MVFFFKKKTAYEILRRDWSSDVCFSDLKINHGIFPNMTVYDDLGQH